MMVLVLIALMMAEGSDLLLFYMKNTDRSEVLDRMHLVIFAHSSWLLLLPFPLLLSSFHCRTARNNYRLTVTWRGFSFSFLKASCLPDRHLETGRKKTVWQNRSISSFHHCLLLGGPYYQTKPGLI